jgi:hypothetical protein
MFKIRRKYVGEACDEFRKFENISSYKCPIKKKIMFHEKKGFFKNCDQNYSSKN